MRDAEPRAIRLEDYQPPAFTTDRVALNFVINDGSTEVASRLEVRRQGPGDLELDGQELELIRIAVDGRTLADNEYRLTEEQLTIFGLPDTAQIEIETRIYPEQNTALEGLYRSQSMYSTQCEAQGFRKITYYQDRPDVSAKFTTTIDADAERFPVLLANGNCIGQVRQGNRKVVTWEDPFPKPSYLFALVAGDLARIDDVFTTMSGREVALQIFSEPHNISQCDYAMDALKRSMRWDEEVFGREYDLDIFMIVAVEDFNMGAMENKGLNIFNTACVLASPDTATDLAYQRVEAVVAHEYFHNWSGNRVTCRDWFQLSLKEGFTVFRDAEFSSDMNSRTVKRIEDVRLLRSVQFAEDAGPLAHPVRPASYIEISNFYTVTIYEKGAEVVRMLHTLLGPERFRKGSDLYFERHDGSAATTEDFVAAMQAQTDVDLAQFQRWYDQAGTPVVRVATEQADSVLTIQLHQSCPPTPGQSEKQPFLIPVLVSFVDETGAKWHPSPNDISSSAELEERTGEWLVRMRSREETLELKNWPGQAAPGLSFLRGFSAPVRIEFARSPEDRAFMAAHDDDGFARWDALQSLLVEEVKGLMAGSSVRELIDQVFASLLTEALAAQDAESRFLLATMLTLPTLTYLFEEISPVDPHAIEDAHLKLKTHLAQMHGDAWRSLYDQSASDVAYSPAPTEQARRALRNLALSYLAVGHDASALLLAHYDQADNLTDRRAAFGELAHSSHTPDAVVAEILQRFYADHKDEALVVDAWIGVQASAPRTGVAELRGLEQHTAYDAKNPNKLRSLIGAFAAQNFRNFHALDGSGYAFLADKIIELNDSNPQMASRLCTELTRYRRYDTNRQRLMRNELERIAQQEGLSKDVFEVVTKSLADA